MTMDLCLRFKILRSLALTQNDTCLLSFWGEATKDPILAWSHSGGGRNPDN